MQILNDLKALAKLERACVTATLKNSEAIHVVAYNYLAHCVNTGDVRLLQRLHDALPLKYQLAIQVWATDFGNVLCIKGVFKHSKTKVAKLAEAATTSPMDHQRKKISKAQSEFDFAASLQRLIDKAKKHNIDGKKINALTAVLA